MNLSKEDIINYYYNSYVKVDGLWFIKMEENYGFDKALDLDNEVWKVLPKIQARFLKDKLGLKQGIDSLYACLSEKLKLDNFKYDIKKTTDKITLSILRCPWHVLMQKSNRENFSEKIGKVICNSEYSVIAKEFGEDIGLKISSRICSGDNNCKFIFKK